MSRSDSIRYCSSARVTCCLLGCERPGNLGTPYHFLAFFGLGGRLGSGGRPSSDSSFRTDAPSRPRLRRHTSSRVPRKQGRSPISSALPLARPTDDGRERQPARSHILPAAAWNGQHNLRTPPGRERSLLFESLCPRPTPKVPTDVGVGIFESVVNQSGSQICAHPGRNARRLPGGGPPARGPAVAGGCPGRRTARCARSHA